MLRLRTRFTERFGIRIPVMGGPMAGVSGGELAAAVARAGGLGFIAAGHARDPDFIDRQIQLFRAKTADLSPQPPLCLGFITHGSFPGGHFEFIVRKHRPQIVQFFGPALQTLKEGADNRSNLQMSRELGVQCVMAQVGSIKDATAAVMAGFDVIIAQGREAGGHGLRTEEGCGTLPLSIAVCKLVRETTLSGPKPLTLAAGGICDGRAVAAALCMGCDGVVLGTRCLCRPALTA